MIARGFMLRRGVEVPQRYNCVSKCQWVYLDTYERSSLMLEAVYNKERSRPPLRNFRILSNVSDNLESPEVYCFTDPKAHIIKPGVRPPCWICLCLSGGHMALSLGKLQGYDERVTLGSQEERKRVENATFACLQRYFCWASSNFGVTEPENGSYVGHVMRPRIL